MATMDIKSLDRPDETRKFVAHGHLEVVSLTGMTLGRATFEPGWRWSNDVRPIAGTESCMAAHAGYVIAGRMGLRMDDGAEGEVGPGDGFYFAPGHDAWVVGDEPCIMLDFTAAEDYAKPRS